MRRRTSFGTPSSMYSSRSVAWILSNVSSAIGGSAKASSNPSMSDCSSTGPEEIAALARTCSGSSAPPRTPSNSSAIWSSMTVRSPAISAAMIRSDTALRRSWRDLISVSRVPAGQSQGGVCSRFFRSIPLLSVTGFKEHCTTALESAEGPTPRQTVLRPTRSQESIGDRCIEKRLKAEGATNRLSYRAARKLGN